MTPFFKKARLQAACTLLLAASLLGSKLSLAASADTLDDAVQIASTSAEAPLFPRAMMAQPQAFRFVRISPDGKTLAYLLARGRAHEVWLYDIDKDTHTKLFASKIADQVFWSTDSQYLFLESRKGVGVVSLKDPQVPSYLINLDHRKDELFYRVDPTHPHAVIVSQQTSDATAHVFYRVLPNGEKEELFTSRAYVGDVLPAGANNQFFAVRINGTVLEVVRIKGDTTTHLMDCTLDDRCDLAAYQQSTNRLLMRGTFGNDQTGLYSVDTKGGTTTLLHSDPEKTFDLQWLILDQKAGIPHAVGYVTDETRFYGLEPAASKIIKHISDKMMSSHLVLRANRDLTRWVGIDASRNLPDIRLYDATRNVFRKPFEALLEGKDFDSARTFQPYLAPRVPIWYTVSDGMRQQGYVTLPLGKDPATVPLVVMPHGGPWSRDASSYDSQVQFLANRGYAVFQPNFRSSTGFGKHYMHSADRDFGDGRVQQDIIDGMNYVLSRGIGNKDKLGIFGHSFGGFSTLSALAFTPDLFKVGVAGAPPVDLTKAIKFFKDMDRSRQFKLRLANFMLLAVDIDDPADVKRLRGQSPDVHWEKVSKPLYIWAGKKDPKVSVLNVRDYAMRLSDAGKPVSYIEEPREEHGPRGILAREAYLYMVEKALADHLQGRMDKSMSKRLKRHLTRTLVMDDSNLLQPETN